MELISQYITMAGFLPSKVQKPMFVHLGQIAFMFVHGIKVLIEQRFQRPAPFLVPSP